MIDLFIKQRTYKYIPTYLRSLCINTNETERERERGILLSDEVLTIQRKNKSSLAQI